MLDDVRMMIAAYYLPIIGGGRLARYDPFATLRAPPEGKTLGVRLIN